MGLGTIVTQAVGQGDYWPTILLYYHTSIHYTLLYHNPIPLLTTLLYHQEGKPTTLLPAPVFTGDMSYRSSEEGTLHITAVYGRY